MPQPIDTTRDESREVPAAIYDAAGTVGEAIDGYAEKIAAQARDDERRRILDAAQRPGATVAAADSLPNVINGAAAATPDAALTLGPKQVRDAALRLVNAQRGMRSEDGDRLESTIRAALSEQNQSLDGSVVARRILATENDHYRSAFAHLMSGDSNPLLTDEEIRALRAFREVEIRNAGTEGTPAQGGFGVPVFIDPTILLRSGASAAPVWDAARKVPVTTNVWKGVSSAPVTFSFQQELAAATDGMPSLAQPTITVYTARGFVPYSIEVEQDYAGWAEELGGLLEQGWVDSIATKTITGTGSNEPKGVLTALDALTTSEVRVDTAGTFDAAQIFKVWNALPERFRARASWLMSVSVESKIRSFGATANPSPYFTVDLTADGVARINGRPNLVTDYMPTLVSTTATANYAIVGDLAAGVTIATRQGMNVERIQTLFMSTTANTPAVPYGARGFFAWGRWGQDVVVGEALRLVNQT